MVRKVTANFWKTIVSALVAALIVGGSGAARAAAADDRGNTSVAARLGGFPGILAFLDRFVESDDMYRRAEAIAAAAQRTGGLACVAQTRRWCDDFRTAQAALASGELGEPRAVKFINWQYNPRPVPQAQGTASLNSRPEAAAFEWRDHAATGGGLLWELGVHYFDQLLQLTGRAAESVRTPRQAQPPSAWRFPSR